MAATHTVASKPAPSMSDEQSNNEQPPAPQSEVSPEGFPHQAAKLSLGMVLLLVLSGIASRSLREGGMDVATIEWIRLGIIVVGFVLAIVALAGIRTYGSKGLAGRGTAGLLVNGLLLFIFAQNYLAAKQRAERNAQDLERLGDVSRDHLKEQLANTNLNDMEGRLQTIDKLGKQLEQASAGASGDAQKLATGMAAFVKRVKSGLANYEQASAAFDVDTTLDFSEVKEVAELERRRAVVNDFIKQNAALQEIYENITDVMREELVKAGLGGAKLQQVILNASQRDQTVNQAQVAMRKNDNLLGEAAVGMIAVLEEQWGKWRWVKDKEAVFVEDEGARAEYSAFVDQLNEASVNTTELNEKMLAAMEAERKRQAARK